LRLDPTHGDRGGLPPASKAGKLPAISSLEALMHVSRAFVPALVVAVMALAGRTAAQDDIASILQARVDQIRNGAAVQAAGQTIGSTIVLPDFYERRDFQPAWSDANARRDLLAALRDSESDGLLPRDYHTDAIERLVNAPASPETAADLDLLATDAVVRLAHHLRFGKVDPSDLDRDWNFRPQLESALRGPPAVALQRALDQHELTAALDSLRPDAELYRGLRKALADYRRIDAAGGWRSIPAGPTLRPGESDPRVAALRTRLAVEGDLPAGAPDSGAVYDGALALAVQHFQTRHGLGADGVIGPATLAALNVPCSTRISQLRLSLERGRLILHDLPPRFVLVNVAGFRVYYADEGNVRFTSRVIVGKMAAKTPIFKAEMTSVVLNPSWTIPPGIMQRDVIPGMKRDPNYLQKKGYKRVGGQVVQAPGPKNALGQVKLMFPNEHLVYLHDTPNRELFAKDVRTLSSGCIRTENVVDLAVLVLDDAEWSKEKVESVIAAGKTRTISLKRPVPVLLTYWTAAVRPDNDDVFFYHDVYDRDPAALRALDGPFRFDPTVAARAAAVSQR
jgi:murein L,D-transpeptidase YcbB/YkuD